MTGLWNIRSSVAFDNTPTSSASKLRSFTPCPANFMCRSQLPGKHFIL